VNQDGSAPWSGTTDVTFRLNVVRNVGSGFSIAANPSNALNQVTPLARVAVADNLVTNVNSSDFNGSRKIFVVLGSVADVAITHNSVVNPGAAFATLIMGTTGDLTTHFRFADNLTASVENWGVSGDGVGLGTAAMNRYAPDGLLSGNVFGGTADQYHTVAALYPAGNIFLPDVASVGFANVSGGDYHLTVVSPAKGKATDGRDPGADIDALGKATAGVVIP
jgi:hypothetical protein